MNCTDKEQETCQVEKRGCEGCFYNKNEIEEREYVRTKDGIIGIFVRYSLRKWDSPYKSPFNCFIKLQNRKSNLQCHRDYIVNHSKNKLDLLTEKDIVEYKINSLSELKVGIVKKYRDARSNKEYLGVEGFDITKIYIKRILTHEQFTANCYEVEDK